MNYKDYRNIITAVAKALAMFAVALILCSLIGCKRMQYIEKPVVMERKTTDTLLINTFSLDSIYVHDSVYINTYQRGDTIFRDINRDHTEYNGKSGGGVVYKVRVDSVPYKVEVPVIKEVEKPLTRWQELKMNVGGGAMVAAVLMLGLFVWRIVKK